MIAVNSSSDLRGRASYFFRRARWSIAMRIASCNPSVEVWLPSTGTRIR
jgi:hypothetical protein